MVVLDKSLVIRMAQKTDVSLKQRSPVYSKANIRPIWASISYKGNKKLAQNHHFPLKHVKCMSLRQAPCQFRFQVGMRDSRSQSRLLFILLDCQCVSKYVGQVSIGLCYEHADLQIFPQQYEISRRCKQYGLRSPKKLEIGSFIPHMLTLPFEAISQTIPKTPS